jgi:outer membrane receptor protein involved in Fe transport
MTHALKTRLACGVAAVALATASGVHAEEAVGAAVASAVDEVVVVGTRIKGAKTTEALPVTVVSADQIAATGAVTGDDLLRTLPEMGTVAFNSANGQQTSNSARGDVGSIDLRGAGVGNTLVLVNGRRIVAHPTSQSKGNVPLISYNSQVLPTVGMDRLEVLRQGAGAIYGADAVAGVVNVVTRTRFDGVTVEAQGGFAEGTHRREFDENIFAGHNFAEGRGNVSLSLDLYQRTAQRPSDEPYTASQDLRPFFANNAGFNTSSAPDNRGNQGSWPSLVAFGVRSAVKQGTTSLTTAAGSFHIQPNTLSGCVSQIGNGLCIATGTTPFGTTANVLKYDANANDAVTISPSIDRQNASFNAHYDITDDFTAYTEVDYYHAMSHGLTTQPTALVPIGVPASNYFNPFGPVTFADGTPNPNRLPNLANVPASGLPVTFATYRFNDLGPDHVDVENEQYRLLLGARGHKWGFDWDSAVLYGKARVVDSSDGVDSAALARQLALSTPDAYNPFNGSCLNGAGGGDCVPSSPAALNAIRLRLQRVDETSLTNADFKITRPDLFRLPAGPVGIALGVEARRETHADIRDPHTNGAITFTDPVTGALALSDATGVNVTPSTSGARTVASAYAEFAVPVISPEMHVPLVREVNLQLAGRYEHYSDFGDVAKPKVAMAWDVVEGVRVRASWEKGFKAPNLETTAPFTFARAQSVTDFYRCQADLNTHKIANFSACSAGVGVTYRESGNPSLQPENSESYDVGLVLQPRFVPDAFGRFTITIDRWQLKQEGIVGVVGPANIAIQDYLSRVRGGSGSPNVIRAAPTADDIAEFAGSGLTPVGAILSVDDTFLNLQPQTISGVDLSVAWTKPTERFGDFDAQVDATYLDKYFQPPTSAVQALFDARAAGVINPATPLTNPGSQIENLGNPRWRGVASLTWRLRPFQVGGSVQYVGETRDTNFLSTTGEPFRVKSQTVVNLYGQYSLKPFGDGPETRVRLGVRNLFDKDPPLESDGYNGALFNPYGRFWYLRVGVSF